MDEQYAIQRTRFFWIIWLGDKLTVSKIVSEKLYKLFWMKPYYMSSLMFSFCLAGHINNQYNTCFWVLVKSGETKTQSQDYLKVTFLWWKNNFIFSWLENGSYHLALCEWLLQGTQAREKNELLSNQFGIEYNSLPLIFRMGSSVFRLKVSIFRNLCLERRYVQMDWLKNSIS